MSLDLTAAREIFENSTDFTVGIEEEFAILDPVSLDLASRFEELRDRAQGDQVMADSVAGELISSEIEIRSGRGETFAEAVALQERRRRGLFELARDTGVRLGATGAHPWSAWHDQRIIDTDHYRRVERDLGYVAWRNNTFSLHVHVGVRGADRAIAVCDRLRMILPELLAVSASSPFVEGRDSGLHSARSQLFTRNFPRCGVPDPFIDWAGYSGFVDLLKRVNSVVEATQLWWSVRPHHSFGTVEVRICDAQPSAGESTALAGLIVATVAQSALEYDEGRRAPALPGRYVEENLWRAIRHGLEGKMIDLDTLEEYPSAAIPERLLRWTAPARAQMGIEPILSEIDPAQRLRAAAAELGGINAAFAAAVEETAATYVGSGPVAAGAID